jgi:hypothetical protein
MKSTFTKKAFVSALKQADSAMVLGPVTGMSAAQRNGCTILAVERAAQKFLGVSLAAGMTHLTIEQGTMRKAPKWFAQMMVKVSWNARDLNVIRIGDLLANC